MFDIGWSELVVIGVVALIAIGPKELPGVLRMVGQYMGKIRRMASEFQGQFQEAMREAEMADLKKHVDEMTDAAKGFTDFDPLGDVKKEVDSFTADPLGTTPTPTPAPEPASASPEAAAPGTPAPVSPDADHSAAVRRTLTIAPEAPQPEAAEAKSTSSGERRVTTEEDEKEIEASKAPLMEHLIELRSRLIKALVAFFVAAAFCFFFAKPIYNILVWPFVWVAGAENSKFIYTALLEYFITQLKLALFGAAFISFPVIAAQIYMFVAPGLYRHERGAFLPYLVATPFFFALGARGGLFHRDADDRAVLARHAAVGRRRHARDRAAAQGRRISVADDVADPGVRRRVPAAGDPDAARPHRHRHLGDAEGQAALFHRRRLRHRRGADAAGRASASSRSRSRCCCSTRARSGRCRSSRARRPRPRPTPRPRLRAAPSQAGGVALA